MRPRPLLRRLLVVAAGTALLAGCAKGVSPQAIPAAIPDGAASPSASASQAPAQVPAARKQHLVAYHGPIEHIFFHPLIVRPDRAYGGPGERKFDEYFVSVAEFKRMLVQIYRRDYVLVDINSIVREQPAAPTLTRAPLMLPKGKRPLVLSIDDLSYYPWMTDGGTNRRLVLDEHGDVAAERTDARGRPVVSRDTEIVPIVDRFVQRHPDFSVGGAKGVIALTGLSGILGYHTSGLQAPDAARARSEAAAVAPVVQRLKATGWTFASHSFSHQDVASASLAHVRQDARKWRRLVEPLIGDTAVYVFPFGSSVPPGTAKFRFLQRMGFRIFCAIAQVPSLVVGRDYALQDRVHMDGTALLLQSWSVSRFFDPAKVTDRSRPPL